MKQTELEVPAGLVQPGHKKMLINLSEYIDDEYIITINEIIYSSKNIMFQVPPQTVEHEWFQTMEPKEIDVYKCAIALIERPNKPDYRERLSHIGYGREELK